MNQLENVTLENSNFMNGNITNAFIRTQNLNIEGYAIINIDEKSAINIGGDIYSGLDLKEMLQLKNKLKQIYPEMFI